MMRIFKQAAVAIAALTMLAGCGQLPTTARSNSWSSPSAVLAIRNTSQRALFYHKAVLGTDEIKPGLDRGGLEAVVQNYRVASASTMGTGRGAADLAGYVSRLGTARKRDAGLGKGTDLTAQTTADLANAASEYQGAFQSIVTDIDAKLGTYKKPTR